MTLRSFLDAAYAIQVREANRLGIPLLDALERLRSMGQVTIGREERTPGTAEERATERQNARALANLERAMMGVSKRG